jgi:hypothetical protein
LSVLGKRGAKLLLGAVTIFTRGVIVLVVVVVVLVLVRLLFSECGVEIQKKEFPLLG